MILKNGKDILYLLLLLLITCAIMLKQLVSSGYFAIDPFDSITFARWARGFTESLHEGVVYPRWMPDEFHGYGSPTFLLYSPLSFYLAAFASHLTGAIIEAMTLVKAAALFVMAAGMYFLCAEFYPKKTSFIAAAFYLTYPFTLLKFYLFSSLASTVALAWFSPILLFTCRYLEKRRHQELIYAGACFGGLIATHLITAYMFALILAVILVVVAILRRRVADALALPVILAVAALVSAAYLWPVIFERGLVQLHAFVTEGSGYDFSKYFLLPDRTGELPPYTFWPVYRNFIFVHTLALFAVALFCCFVARVYGNRGARSGPSQPAAWAESMAVAAAVAAFGVFLLMFGISEVVWKTVPFFRYIQFPIRWLPLLVYLASLLVAHAVHAGEAMLRLRSYQATFSLLLCWQLFLDADYVRRTPPLSKAQLSEQIEPPLEHLPAGVDLCRLRRELHYGRAVVVEGKGRVEIVSWSSERRSLQVTADQPVTIRLRTLAFPGWKGELDGKDAELTATAYTKALLVKVPAGAHRVTLHFTDTPIRRWGKLATAGSLLFLLLVPLVGRQLRAR